MYKVLTALFAALCTLIPHAASMCRQVDIISIIGGSNYTVLDLKFVHFNKDYINAIFVAATILRKDQTAAEIVAYSVDYSFCKVDWI